jgi:signal transduction histidine kinase
MIVNESGRVLACNEYAIADLGIHQGFLLPDDGVGILRQAIASKMITSANVSWPGSNQAAMSQIVPILSGSEPIRVMITSGESSPVSRDRQFRQLLGGLSHELRTPLTAIGGHIEILKGASPNEEDLQQRSLDFLAHETARMTRLVEDLLRLSSLGGTPLEIRPVSPRSVAEEAIADLYGAAEEKSLRMRLEASPSLPRVSADPDRLKQVIINLLDNAIKFTPRHGRIHVTVESANGDVRFEVADSGQGIPPQDQSFIFDPFFHGNPAKVEGSVGAGLGLAIVKSILDQHGADINLESSEAQGTRFWFVLRRA